MTFTSNERLKNSITSSVQERCKFIIKAGVIQNPSLLTLTLGKLVSLMDTFSSV